MMKPQDFQSLAAADAAQLLDGKAKKYPVMSAGLAWSVMECGQGDRTLVFIPGTLGTVDIFCKQVLEFSVTARVVVLGYPGVSDRRLMTASCYELLKQLRIEEADFVGSSLGAYWLQAFTCEDARCAKSLVLGNTFIDPRRLRFIKMFQSAYLESADADHVKQSWMDFVHGLASEELKAFLADDVGGSQDAGELYGRSLTIAQAEPVPLSAVPPERISIITCDDDKVIVDETARELVNAYPAARHVRFESGGHYPHILNTAAYNEEIYKRCGIAK